ncbi:MAG TPA: PepSY-like domain-containing protein [Chitinophaga sp.]|uniref:PepSY-like domain-containing protein n=1 Tax=Chitinophaga sp. TaxID=1869181 RepID=UPI002DB86753|nr:PepSY-like domain-containing protein [Chitinophaga sp.]HEU4553113.1 PepSY-like domain-containing protein [Chitinophaga sp.]
MKKLMLFFCATLFTSGIAFAQHKTAKKSKHTVTKTVVAPEPVKGAFEQNFAGITNAKWSKGSSGNWTANFSKDDIKTAAEYSANGNWIATRSEYKADQLPESVTTTLKEKYPTAVLKDGWKIERADVAAYYKVNIQDNGTEKSVLINEAGTVTE